MLRKADCKKEQEEQENNQKIIDSEFMPLNELVYATIQALEDSNLRLNNHAIKVIKSLGKEKVENKKDIIELENMRIAFEQIHSDNDDGYCVDNMQLDIPLLSLISITNMSIKNAEISFSTELCVETSDDGKKSINARVTAPEQRNSDFLPRATYTVRVASTPATEGLMRLSDMLNSNQIAKKTDSPPVSMSGELVDERQKENWKKLNALKTNVKRFKRLYEKMTELIAEQKKIAVDSFELDTISFEENRKNIIKKIIELEGQIAELESKSCMDSLE